MQASKLLGERVHPKTGRRMGYVACHITGGTARVIDTDELRDLARATPDQIPTYVPYGLAPVVHDHLERVLR